MSDNSEKVKKPIYKKWWFWLIIIIVIGAIAGSSANNSSTTTTGSNSNSSSSTSSEDLNKIYSVGEEATLGSGSVTVTKVEKSNGTTYNKPKSGKEFVIVYITIKNNGNTNLSYNPFYFKVQNSQGQQEDKTFTIVDQDTALQSGELIPGGTVSGTVVFEQPVNDSNLTLIYQDNVWSNKSLQIKLQ